MPAFRLLMAALLVHVAGCGPGAVKSAPEGSSASAESPRALGSTSASSSVGAASSRSAPSATADVSAAAAPFVCGELSCRAFASAEEAFVHVLEQDKPLVLALGESHAQKGSEGVRSTTSRFTEQLLPKLEGKASALVLELWVADGKCGKATEGKVAEQQKEVTKSQAQANPNEFVKMGEKSKSLGVTPFLLKPSCEEYETIKKAGEDAVLEMLAMITRNMRSKVEALFKETEKKAPGKMVVAYGGALHNDVVPAPGREQWSFAKDLDKLAPGRYVELDLIVPEYIKDNDSWRKLPWYGAYDRERLGKSVILISVAPRSYALVFARSAN